MLREVAERWDTVGVLEDGPAGAQPMLQIGPQPLRQRPREHPHHVAQRVGYVAAEQLALVAQNEPPVGLLDEHPRASQQA
ncbi:hypothetical protein [Salinispora arenicola]|uniref:hypothetical protein n=1 Tax=Salinispora arenicola TaxID=168697 RepID=UPI0027DDB9A0|nr:hypothetical protein [Salinispora arenicola]